MTVELWDDPSWNKIWRANWNITPSHLGLPQQGAMPSETEPFVWAVCVNTPSRFAHTLTSLSSLPTIHLILHEHTCQSVTVHHKHLTPIHTYHSCRVDQLSILTRNRHVPLCDLHESTDKFTNLNSQIWYMIKLYLRPWLMKTAPVNWILMLKYRRHDMLGRLKQPH